MTDPLHLDVSPWRADVALDDDVTYLNHGSFGPSPAVVRAERQRWTERLESQPMRFFVREMEGKLDNATAKLGEFVGCPAKDLIFVDNATFGMNIAAETVPLSEGDEVLLTDHEYGAVVRIWRQKCHKANARVVTASLNVPPGAAGGLCGDDDIVAALFESVTDRTRLIVISQVTSPTAIVLPVKAICAEARKRDIPVCIDGPHALAMLPIDLRAIDCDFYTVSCHKWLCAPFGTGFLYVSPRWQGRVKPSVVSWGGSVAGRQASWKDEFQWIGTRDPAGFLAVPAAIDYLRDTAKPQATSDACEETTRLEIFRERGHQLAREYCSRMQELTGLPAFVADKRFATMVAAELPPLNADPPVQGQRDPLQDALYERFHIEIPVVHWQGRRLLRVSCHLYNDRRDLDRLFAALDETLDEFSR